MDAIEKELENLLSARRDEMKQKYNRVLPTGELLCNRYQKAEYIKAGNNSSIYDTSVIMGDVEIGENVWVGPYTLIEGINGNVKIGNFVSINSGVMIFTHDSTKYYISGGIDEFKKGDVTIGSHTVIGSTSIISQGVCIGEHCVVAAGSFVNNDVEDNTIVAGNPAKKIGIVHILEDGHVYFKYLK